MTRGETSKVGVVILGAVVVLTGLAMVIAPTLAPLERYLNQGYSIAGVIVMAVPIMAALIAVWRAPEKSSRKGLNE